VQLALSELVADLGVFPCVLGECTLQSIAFGTDLGWVTEFEFETVALCQDIVELVLAGAQRIGQMCALNSVGIVFASESSTRRGQVGQALVGLLALAAERGSVRVEILDALQLACR
jgi:translation initiation factor 6 (eIF-6)